jgi:hypothetical protein
VGVGRPDEQAGQRHPPHPRRGRVVAARRPSGPLLRLRSRRRPRSDTRGRRRLPRLGPGPPAGGIGTERRVRARARRAAPRAPGPAIPPGGRPGRARAVRFPHAVGAVGAAGRGHGGPHTARRHAGAPGVEPAGADPGRHRPAPRRPPARPLRRLPALGRRLHGHRPPGHAADPGAPRSPASGLGAGRHPRRPGRRRPRARPGVRARAGGRGPRQPAGRTRGRAADGVGHGRRPSGRCGGRQLRRAAPRADRPAPDLGRGRRAGRRVGAARPARRPPPRRPRCRSRRVRAGPPGPGMGGSRDQRGGGSVGCPPRVRSLAAPRDGGGPRRTTVEARRGHGARARRHPLGRRAVGRHARGQCAGPRRVGGGPARSDGRGGRPSPPSPGPHPARARPRRHRRRRGHHPRGGYELRRRPSRRPRRGRAAPAGGARRSGRRRAAPRRRPGTSGLRGPNAVAACVARTQWRPAWPERSASRFRGCA